MRHKLTHADEVKGGKDSHMHHKKMHDHHLKEAKKHAHHMMKKAMHHGHHHVTPHDRAMDRKNIAKARRMKSHEK